MKKKFIIFTLCFTLIFSSLNYKKTHAMDFVVTPTVAAAVATVAVGCGIVLSSNDDIYDITRIVYDNFKGTHEEFMEIFNSSVTIGANKVVTVGKEFLDICKFAFDTVFLDSQLDYIGSYNSIPFVNSSDALLKYHGGIKIDISGNDFSIGDIYFKRVPNMHSYEVYYNGSYINSMGLIIGQTFSFSLDKFYYNYDYPNCLGLSAYYRPYVDSPDYVIGERITLDLNFTGNVYGLPYTPGSYDWDNVDSKKNEDGSVGVYVPGYVGDLVGIPGGSTLDNPSYELPNDGLVVVPGVDDPSIGLDGDSTFPNVGDIPGDIPGVDDPSIPSEGLWASITDYIIGLVVPSDTFWTDTWGGLYDNFINAFPMVDMDNFSQLVVGEKKFPNIDINIFGSTGRVVNGDIVNSIVDWLRPIVAGFVMLCLMFFNYRKLYKLIRNSEPFEGIGKVENHAN